MNLRRKGMTKMSRKKQSVNVDTIKRLLSYLKPHKVRLTIVVVLIIISAVASASSALFMQSLIDDYIAPLLLESNADFSGLAHLLLMMGGIFLAGVLSTLFFTRIMAVLAQRVLKEIRDDMFSHMQTLPIGYFDSHSHGDIMSRYTNDTDTLRQMIAMALPQVFSSCVTIITVVISMLTVSVWLTLFTFLCMIGVLQVIKFITGHSRRYFVAQQETIGEVNGYIEEMIHGQKVIKVFNHEEKAKEGFDAKNEKLFENATQANTYANILMPAVGNLGYILYVLIAIVGGAMAIFKVTNLSLTGFDVITLGMIASFLQLSRSFINPISQVSQQISPCIMALAGAERIFNLIDEKPEEDDGYVELVNAEYNDAGELVEADHRTGLWAWKHPHQADGTVSYRELKGDVELEHVDFSYVPGKQILHDITLYAKPGQKVAFVGSTGAGKTTITNLINRFYDIDGGKIRYDGINISKIKKPDLRRSLGIVLQDVHLFSGTIMDNLRYGRLDATDEECIAAAKLANADTFINLLPDGYNTYISGSGEGISQGQRQLLSIARAAVANPPVMILDEATSSIDTRTEIIVQDGMDKLMKGRTVFVIAHRLSTIKNSDVIMVMDHGRIIERGNHDELLAKKGRYYQLYTGAIEMD